MSGNPEIDLPASWSKSELSALADLVRGVSYKKEDASTSPFASSMPLLRATNITGNSLTFDNLVYVPSRYVSPDQHLRQGDIVVASSSGSKEVVGKAGQMTAARELYSFGAFCTGVRPTAEIEPRYLGYYFESPEYRDAISDISAGSSINNIKSSDLAAHVVPVAPRAEQSRIVEKLEELLSDLDAGVAELKAAQRKLAKYRQSLLKAAVEGALTADWRAAHGTPQETGADLLQRVLTERRARWEQKQLARFAEQGKTPPKDWQAKYSEPAPPDLSELPQLPDGWVWAGFEQVFDAVSDGGRKLPQAEYAQRGEFPVIDQGAKFVGGYTNDASLLFDGNLPVIVFGDHTRRFKLLRTPFVIGADGAKLIGLSKAWNPDFAFISFDALKFEDRGYSRHFQFVRNSAFPLPPLHEQTEIAARFNSQLDSLADLASAVEASLRQADAQRKNLLQTAFNGQLVPQDPNDEPASELLARIRAERASNDGGAKRRRRKTA